MRDREHRHLQQQRHATRAQQEEPEDEQDVIEPLRQDVLEAEHEVLPRRLDQRRLDEAGAQVEGLAVLAAGEPDGGDRLSATRATSDSAYEPSTRP